MNGKKYFVSIRRFLLFAAMGCCIGHTATAQLSDSVSDVLRKVSAVMYGELNNKFAIVDAIVDGHIKLKSPYTFIYDNGSITINEAELSEREKEIYVKKLEHIERLKNLKSDAGYAVSGRVSFYSKGIDLNEIVDVASDFRKFNPGMGTESLSFHRAMRSIAYVFSNDGLLDTAAQYTIRYNIHGLFINNVAVPVNVTAKYIKLINENGFTVASVEDQLYIDREQIISSSKK